LPSDITKTRRKEVCFKNVVTNEPVFMFHVDGTVVCEPTQAPIDTLMWFSKYPGN
jgi:hypothetical protein